MYCLLFLVLADSPQDQQIDDLFWEAVTAIQLEKFEQAISYLDKVLKIRPDDVDVLCSKAGSLAELERYDESIACYDKALEFEPGNVFVSRSKALALEKFDKSEEAIASYDKALLIKPDDMGLLYEKGQALKRFGRHEESKACLEKLQQIKSEIVGIPFEKRRQDFGAYLKELILPSTEDRCILCKRLLDLLYNLRPDLVYQISDETKGSLMEMISKAMEKNRSYFEKLASMLNFLRAGYPDYDTEEKVAEFIDNELSQIKIAAGIFPDLRAEFLKIWKVNRLGMKYFGDITEKFDGFAYLHMAEFLIYEKIPAEKAMQMLIDNHFSTSTRNVPLRDYLLGIDIEWAVRDLIQAPHENNKIQFENYEIIFDTKGSIQITVTNGIEIRKDGQKFASFAFGGDPVRIFGKTTDEEEYFTILTEILQVLEMAAEKLRE